jgi:hypothetical protein
MASPAELDRAIVAAVTDPDEQRASRVLVRALGERSQTLGGGGLPADDRVVSERILAEARVRSARIAGEQAVPPPPAASAIPWWLWLAWAVALAGAWAAWRWLA